METIYDFITKSRTDYTKPISLEEGWDWSMKEHLRRSFLYKHSQFEEENDNRTLRPNKNIIKAILNVSYRTEGFDVKDIELYVNNPDIYYKSFLVKKYHDKWALENEIDTFIDDVVESYVDYGGVLTRNTDKSRPEVIDLRSIAFCNQTNILEFPFGILHKMSFSELRKQSKWNKDEVESLITILKAEDEDEAEVYEVHGVMEGAWLGEKNGEPISEEKDVPQIQIVAFYKDQNKNEIGKTLFKSKEPKLPFKFLQRDKIGNRALGWGGVEELFEPQKWTNFSEIKITEMLDSASKILFKTTDPNFKSRNNLTNVEANEVLVLQEAKDISQIDTFPRNLATFNEALNRWEEHAKQMGSASEGLLGEAPSSGTPFKLFEAQNIEAKGMHRYRQGQISVFIDGHYRDWILPHLGTEIANEQKFLSELSSDEMQKVFEDIAENDANKKRNNQVLDGEIPEDKEALKQTLKEKLLKGGNRRFIEILKDELKKEDLGVMTNIAGKQKNLALMTDKLVNVLRQFLSTPEIRQDPEMVKLLNVILESSGMSPILFGTSPQIQAQPQQGGGSTEPLKALAEAKQPVA